MHVEPWWRRCLKLFAAKPIRRKKPGLSTRLMHVELLEDRWMPANIFIAVTTTADGAGAFSGSGTTFTDTTLRGAVAGIASHNLHGNISILLGNATYTVNQGEILLGTGLTSNDSLTIRNSTGAALSTINAQSDNRIFETTGNAAFTLAHLILENGNAPAPNNATAEGGAIFNSGKLTLTNDQFNANQATGYGGETGPQNAYGGAIFNNGNGALTIKNTTFNGNSATGGSGSNSGQHGAGAEGGAVYIAGGSKAVSITASTFSNNSAVGGTGTPGGSGYGGAISAASGGSNNIAVLNSTFSNNNAEGGVNSYGGAGSAYGGALNLAGNNTLSVVNSTFNGNLAYGGAGNNSYGGGGGAVGGAINVNGVSTATFVNSTVANNTATGGDAAYGGSAFGGGIGIRQSDATVNLVNDTVALNQVFGGESFNGGESNAFGGGVANPDGNTVKVLNTIIALNQSRVGTFGSLNSDDVNGAFASQGHNLIGNTDGSTGFNTTPSLHDQTGSSASLLDPGLNPAGLQNNGGPTQTIALLPTSPAINRADNGVVTGILANGAHLNTLDTTPLTTDQRGTGFARKADNVVDIGAYEAQLNLNKIYSTSSSATSAIAFTVPGPGLLLGQASFPPPPGTHYVVVLDHPVPGLVINPNGQGGFTYTIPRNFSGSISFTFTIDVVNNQTSVATPTNFDFTATIVIQPPSKRGRDLLADLLGFGFSTNSGSGFG
jgi:hypothetical protein